MTPKDRTRSKPAGLPIIHPFAAGIDIGSRFHVVAVSPDLYDEPVRTFQAFTADLQRMANWLVATGTKTVVMKSTGVYWIAAYQVLESRNSLDYASWKDRKSLAAAIKPIYTAPSAEAAQAELEAFAEGPLGQKFPTVSASWRNAWDRVIPFFAFPPDIRKVIYTTNAIENINSQLRKIIKTRGHFPSDDAATKLIWLALRNITADWGRAAKDWKAAMNQFAILYADRFVRLSV